MFCTKCGKRLYDGDSFCAHCGAKVREELLFKKEVKSAPKTTVYDEVVFNPPFKREAEKRTRSIEAEVENYSTEPRRERISFDWNLDGFPTADRRREDSFEINWDAVIEKKREARAVNVEKIVPEFGFIQEKPEPKVTNIEEDLLFKAPVIEEPKHIEVKEEKVEEIEVMPKSTFVLVEETEDLFKTEEEDKPLTIEELEKALFGAEDFAEVNPEQLDMTIEYKSIKTQKKKEEEFYTFNSQRDAFQELVDKEKARIEALENERQTQWQEIASVEEEMQYTPRQALKFEEVFVEPKTPLVPPLREVAVVLPPLTARVMADEEAELVDVVAEEKVVEKVIESVKELEFVAVELPPLTARVVVEEDSSSEIVETEAKSLVGDDVEPEKEVSPFQGEDKELPSEGEPGSKDKTEETKEKTKLRYSDVFPIGSFDFVGDDKLGKSNEEEIDEEDDEEEGQHIFIKSIIVLLAIIVLLEIAVIGIKFMAPNSKVAMVVDDMMMKITNIFVDEEGGTSPDIDIEQTLSEKYINMLSGDVENIGTVKYNSTLKYDLEKEYAFGEISETNQFQDVAWNGDNEKTNGYRIIQGVISYYDGWTESNEDSDVVGINQVEIGEIRTGNSGYYVLNKIVYAEAAGDVIEKTESVYLEASGDRIMVKEVKEETK